MKEVSCFVTSDCVPLGRQKISEKGTVSILTLHARAEVSTRDFIIPQQLLHSFTAATSNGDDPILVLPYTLTHLS